MTVDEFANKTGCEVAAGTDALNNSITGGYCGDLLSWVMGRAKSGDAWFTVMGNVNAIAVAVLAGISCIVLAEDAVLDDEAKEKALQNNVAVLKSSKSAYDLAVLLSNMI